MHQTSLWRTVGTLYTPDGQMGGLTNERPSEQAELTFQSQKGQDIGHSGVTP